MKKYLFIALAALGFAACAEKDEMGNQPINNGEMEKSYISITLASNDATRAEDELGKNFEDGTPAESEVATAYVFFFRDGVAFPVSYSNNTTTEGHANGTNYLPLTLDMKDETNVTNNVSDYSDEILVIENYRGEYPNQIVAVLNWTPIEPSYNIADLEDELLNIQNTSGKFVMCNSVYADESTPKKAIIATPITEANIGTKDDLDNDKLKAVQIYVERLAAKVEFTTANADGLFETGETVVDRRNGANEEIEVNAKILGYELFDAYYDSWLVKQIVPTWLDSELGFTWNDSPNYRSYWADSYTNRADLSFPASNKFNWNNNPGEAYCGENTRPGENNRTKVVVKAQLVDENGDFVEVVNWLGKTYVGEDYLKIVVANTLKEQYFSYASATYNGIEPKDLKCVTRNSNSEKAYYVDFQLSTDDAGYGVNKTWYKKSADGKYTQVTDMNAELMNVHPALVYKNGQTYYYTDIRHLANDTAKTGAYGVVRNHVYKVNINKVSGFGTPIYDPTQDFVEVETPEEIYTYVSAQINILSWRIVARDYEL
ncbi:MAG: Mfa1 fimbrilin C-terminal domain-containing protein [Alistipes sp.]|nr:Mfa1 fimbrilin C-terminal domain-containing protein [Alistipes sp.]